MNGIVAINKPKGMTSHDVVFKLRKILKMKRIGHTGTLDPEVSGVLVVCLGQATKLVELLMESKKAYEGEITLGFATETEDAYGEIVEKQALTEAIDISTIDQTMQSFVGTIQQVPPMYSAVKVNGKRLYEYARQGMTIERPSRTAEIFQFERTTLPQFNEVEGTQSWTFDVSCGKGTYIRTLAVDLGKALGYPAHMSALRRTYASGMTIGQAVSLEDVAQAVQSGTVEDLVKPIETVLADLPSIVLSDERYQQVKHGQVLDNEYSIDAITAFYYQDRVVALYQPHPSKTGRIKPYRMFTNE